MKIPQKQNRVLLRAILTSTDLNGAKKKKVHQADNAHLPRFLWGCCMIYPRVHLPISTWFHAFTPSSARAQNAHDSSDFPPAYHKGKTRSVCWQLVFLRCTSRKDKADSILNGNAGMYIQKLIKINLRKKYFS